MHALPRGAPFHVPTHRHDSGCQPAHRALAQFPGVPTAEPSPRLPLGGGPCAAFDRSRSPLMAWMRSIPNPSLLRPGGDGQGGTTLVPGFGSAEDVSTGVGFQGPGPRVSGRAPDTMPHQYQSACLATPYNAASATCHPDLDLSGAIGIWESVGSRDRAPIFPEGARGTLQHISKGCPVSRST